MTQSQFNPSHLHRLVKLVMDTGEAATFEEAEGILREYKLSIQVSKNLMVSPAYQAALLTSVNTARRCFLGGVYVYGDLDVPLRISWKGYSTIADAVIDLQGEIVEELDATLPIISFTDKVLQDAPSGFGVRPIIRGWCGGVIPLRDQISYNVDEDFTPAGVLAGAIAVSEAFQFVRGDNPFVGNRPIGLSLWMPEQSNDWLTADQGSTLKSLPSKLWLIGLGHLGQAYLWTLGFLPYTMEKYPTIVLQDIDVLEDANDSTSLLTNRTMIGVKKTRAMANWCEQRGFHTDLIERKFAAGFTVHNDEPHLVLCGVDNAEARADLQKVGFKRIIEAGLGKGTEGFLGFQLHTFPASRTAESYWTPKVKPDEDRKPNKGLDNIIHQPAYQELQSKGLMDQCGLINLAGRSVGASFVGAITSTLVIGQVLRLVHGEKMNEIIDGDLRSSTILNTIIPNQIDLETFNPGIIRI